MEHIGRHYQTQHHPQSADAATAKGFTMLPNFVLKSPN